MAFERMPIVHTLAGGYKRRGRGNAKVSERGGSRAMMSHNDYQVVLKYADEAEVFHGEVVGTRDVIFFEGTSIEELNKEFRFSIDD